MKTKYLSILFTCILCLSISTQAQQVSLCDGQRYVEEVFPDLPLEDADIIYGENENFGELVELKVNVFKPNGDTHTQRPLVIFAHPGAFIYGHRNGPRMRFLCETYARRGYVAATIDYRLIPEDSIDLDTMSAADFVRATIRAGQDMKAAVRYFRSNPDVFGIDTNFIFVGGISAGAFTALHHAYLDEEDLDVNDASLDYIREIIIEEGGLEGNSNDLFDVSSEVQGVINHSGAIFKKEWIHSEDPPLVSYHGTKDDAVPIESGYVLGDVILADGSEVIHTYTSQQNIPNYFYPVPEGGHLDIYDSLVYASHYHTYLENAFAFFEENVLCSSTPFPVEWLSFEVKYEGKLAILDWSTASERNNHYFEIQRSTDAINYRSIGKVDAIGNSTTIANYQFIDEGVDRLGASKLYYRLRQVDFDSQWGYSNIVELNIPHADFSLKVYPNPASSLLFIQSTQTHGEDMQIMLLDLRGRQVLNDVLSPSQKLEWNVEKLPSGIYYVYMRHGQQVFHQKVVVK